MEYFDRLLNVEFSWSRDTLEPVSSTCGPAGNITVQKVREAIAKSKVGKAAGPSGVVAEMLKASGSAGEQWVTDICNIFIKDSRIPDDWRRSWIVSVYKGKGDALDC